MSSSSLPTPASNDVVFSRPAVKRRKVRKGTFSCWECKRRKTRCELQPGSSSVCVSCQRLGLPCVSQEFPEVDDGSYEEVEKSIVHVETLVGQLCQQRRIRDRQSRLSRSAPRKSTLGHEDVREEASRSTRDTTRRLLTETKKGITMPLSSLLTASQDPLTICRSLSVYLHSVLPHPTMTAHILSRGKFFSLSFQVHWQPKEKVPSSSVGTEQLVHVSENPPPTAHPVLFARKLIHLAICLQELETSPSEQPELSLNESVCDAARRYVDIASRHVTSQDLLVESLDGLETLMLEAYYHVTVGHLRVAWLILRRALGIAQIMGFPRMVEKAGSRVDFVWFRLMYSDRFLSLMLGLPLAIEDNSFASEHLLAVNVPSERLERIHVVVVGRIIARNLRMQRPRYHKESEQDVYDDFKETQDIDYELKQASRPLPVSWWVPPTLHTVATDAEAMEKTSRLLTQMHQYYLVVLLHHPYLLPDRQSTSRNSGLSHRSIDYTYSKLAVAAASREVLSCFLVIRNVQRGSSCKGLDDKAFTASTALLLAHINGHHLGPSNVLEHQRPHDMGIISDTIDCMEELSCLTEDVSTNSTTRVLRKLVDIEADAADGAHYIAWSEEGAVGKEDCRIGQEEISLQLSLPFLRTVNITRKGLKRPQLPSPDLDFVQMTELAPEAPTATKHNGPEKLSADKALTIPFPLNGGIPASDSQVRLPVPTCSALEFGNDLTLPRFMPADMQDMSQPSAYTLQEMSPDYTRDAQDCPYQEMDTAFSSAWMQEHAENDESLVETQRQLF